MGMGGMPAGGMGGSASGSRWSPSNIGRYRDDKPEFKTRGFYLEVIMDHRRVPELLVALANADWPINVLRVQEADFRDEDLADASGADSAAWAWEHRGPMGWGLGRVRGGMPWGMGAGAPPGTRQPSLRTGGRSSDESNDPSANNRSPLDDPNLANVAIVGVIYIFKKPPVDPNASDFLGVTPLSSASAGSERQPG